MTRSPSSERTPPVGDSSLPRPFPWLGRPGVVTPLERSSQSSASSPAIPASGGGDPQASSSPEAATPSAGDAESREAVGASPKNPKRPRRNGIEARRSIRVLVWARRMSQATFLLAFLWLLTETAFRGGFAAKAGEPVRLPWPVELFLSLDPFVAVMTLLSTHTVYRGLLLSLVVLVLTFVFGRVFCGWICPFGTLHHVTGWVFPSRYLRGKRRIDANRYHAWQVGKYYLLFAALTAALFGSAIGGLLDPICFAVRAIGLGVIPILQYVGIRSTDYFAQGSVRALQGPAGAAQDYLAQFLWTSEQRYYHAIWLIGFLFVAILFMNRVIPRFWCRALCPLGGMLGALSRFSIIGMQKSDDRCTNCNACVKHCQGADSPEGGVKHRQAECHVCFNCEAACPENVIHWQFFPNLRASAKAPDLERRTAMASMAAGALAVPTLRLGNWPDKAYNPTVIRPPGSVEEREFLARCIRCGECMKVCPNNALHPALFEASIEGLWTPIVVPRIGYCEHSCVLCGQVCPTGAIEKITEKARLGQGQPPVVIGTAAYDHGRCLPWAMSIPCIVCEEFCPVSPKAIWVEEVTVAKRDHRAPADGGHPPMLEVKVQRPHVDPSLCIGCGSCEKACPVVDKPAIYVTSAGESRSRTNVILLGNPRT